MELPNYKSALIVGAGAGLSASLTRLLRQEGLAVAIAARNTAKLEPLCSETGARPMPAMRCAGRGAGSACSPTSIANKAGRTSLST
jgi:NADP-dependent 3-hydroxy acid dehydrogenase YdfG